MSVGVESVCVCVRRGLLQSASCMSAELGGVYFYLHSVAYLSSLGPTIFFSMFFRFFRRRLESVCVCVCVPRGQVAGYADGAVRGGGARPAVARGARPAGDRRAGRQEGPLAGPPHCEADFVGARADRAG